MEPRVIKAGIIGCAQIVPRALINPAKEIQQLEIYGIASRTKAKAEEYAKEYGIQHVFETYEELLECKEIDFVYIALGNDLHMEWILKSLAAGKHVLIEKPICLSSKEVSAIEEAARHNDKLILEGLMVQHHPWQHAIREIIKNQQYGKLISIKSQISLTPKDNYKNNYRSFPQKGGGCFYDLGIYWLQFLQCLDYFNPNVYEGSSDFNGPNGSDWTFYASMGFDDGVCAELITSFELPYKAYHVLEFEKASLKVDDFFRANLGNYKITINIEMNDTKEKKKIVFEPQNYYTNQLNYFCEVIKGSKDILPLQQSFDRIVMHEKIMNKARKNMVKV